jgi:hypothetical protein
MTTEDTTEPTVQGPKRGQVTMAQRKREEFNNGKLNFIYAMFADTSRTLVQTAYFDSEGWGRIENLSTNIVPGSMFSKLIATFDIDQIQEMTNLYSANEEETERDFAEYLEWKAKGGQYTQEVIVEQDPETVTVERVVEVVQEVPVEVPSISVAHIGSNYSHEDLFRMKIEVFDIPSVRDASKELKSRIRKATTPVELFAIIHEANVIFESEQS